MPGEKKKCVVWDLDNTVWDGVLLEGDRLTLRPGVHEALRTLDGRGLLHSVASRNDHEAAWARLTELGLAEYFLAPRIGWGTKSQAIREIAAELNLGIDAFVFVDDDPYERAEVGHALPEVLCLDATEVPKLAERAELNPEFVTAEARGRRRLYQAAARRKEAEEEFEGPQESFLASLEMCLRITPARESDLRRAEELTVRTHQLNATGRTYSYAELDALRTSSTHQLLVAELTDRFGPYGVIGLALVETGAEAWTVRLLLMSCRVMSRGVGAIMVNHLRRTARAAGRPLYADFVRTDRNRMMYIAYRLGGFTEEGRDGQVLSLRAADDEIPPLPDYLRLITDDD
ncbi:HAD-IIIC family phosphatase [Streptomyces cacaoi]